MGSLGSPLNGNFSRTAAWYPAPTTQAGALATARAPRRAIAISNSPSVTRVSGRFQYFPVIKAFYQKQRRRKPVIVARAIVAAELARIVYQVLTKQEAFNGTFRGVPLQRTKTRQWPRLANPAA